MLFINNADVAAVLTMEDTLRVIEEGHREWAEGGIAGRPRVDIYTETGAQDRFHRWGTMEGSSKRLQKVAIRMKSDDSSPSTVLALEATMRMSTTRCIAGKPRNRVMPSSR